MFAMARLSPAAISIGLVAVLLALVPWDGFSQAPDGGAETVATLNRYCVTCHSTKLKTAGLTIDPSQLDHLDTSAEVWENVLTKLRSTAMPPPGARGRKPPSTSACPNT